jgi:hypothetical protein
MDVLPCLLNFRRCNHPKRLRSVLCFVVAANVIPASVAYPKRQLRKVFPVRVHLGTIGQSGFNVAVASTAVDTHNNSIKPTLLRHAAYVGR